MTAVLLVTLQLGWCYDVHAFTGRRGRSKTILLAARHQTVLTPSINVSQHLSRCLWICLFPYVFVFFCPTVLGVVIVLPFTPLSASFTLFYLFLVYFAQTMTALSKHCRPWLMRTLCAPWLVFIFELLSIQLTQSCIPKINEKCILL